MTTGGLGTSTLGTAPLGGSTTISSGGNMAYAPYTWADGAAGGTPISAASLNHLEGGVGDASAGSADPTSHQFSSAVRQQMATNLGDPAQVEGAALYKSDELRLGVYTPQHYGAVADGVTDDGPAIRAATTAAAGKRLFFPAGTYRYKATGALNLAANTNVDAAEGAIINFDVATAGAYTEFIGNSGDNVTVRNLTINRVSDFPSIIFMSHAHAGFTIQGCVVNGNRDTYATNYCHGVQTGADNGTSSNLRILGCTFQKLSYGLFQANASTATINGVTVRDSLFTLNTATDLEFNSPNGTQTDVLVEDCIFKSNQGTGANGGFGVGLAHITRAAVKNCSFTSYYNEAIHVEDYSSSVDITGNTLVSCGLNQGSYIQVISGVSDCRIVGNHIDATGNHNYPYCINVLQGGTGNTPGGRVSKSPLNMVISQNYVNAGGTSGIYIEATLRSIVGGNRLVGAGNVTNGVFGGANGGNAINAYYGTGTVIEGNYIEGFEAAFQRQPSGAIAAGQGFSITGNVVYSCDFGIAMVNTGSGVISGNTMYNCVRPMVTGTGNAAAYPVVVTGNHAYGCTYPMEVGGKLIVITNGAAAVGSAVTLAIKPLALKLLTGQVVTFSGGGVLTLTADASSAATSLVGNLATANVASGESATITGLAHSTVAAQNHITISGNGDSVAGTY